MGEMVSPLYGGLRNVRPESSYLFFNAQWQDPSHLDGLAIGILRG